MRLNSCASEGLQTADKAETTGSEANGFFQHAGVTNARPLPQPLSRARERGARQRRSGFVSKLKGPRKRGPFCAMKRLSREARCPGPDHALALSSSRIGFVLLGIACVGLGQEIKLPQRQHPLANVPEFNRKSRSFFFALPSYIGGLPVERDRPDPARLRRFSCNCV